MKHLARISFLLIFILTLLALPTSAYAQTPNGDGKVVVGGSYRLASGQTLSGSLLVIGGEATLEAGSRIAGDVALLGGTLTIQGEVDGNLAVLGGSVFLDDTAVVTGDLTTIGGSIHRSEKARIEGNVSEGPRNFSLPIIRNISNSINPIGRFVSGLLSSIILAAIAVLAVLFLPRPHRARSRHDHRPNLGIRSDGIADPLPLSSPSSDPDGDDHSDTSCPAWHSTVHRCRSLWLDCSGHGDWQAAGSRHEA